MHQAAKLSIVSEQDVDELLAISSQNTTQTYAIFKHSTRCNISSMALNRMEKTSLFEKFDVPFYYLDLIQFRNVSNYVAQKLNVAHESPQLLIIKDGRCVVSESHNGIRESWLLEAIAP